MTVQMKGSILGDPSGLAQGVQTAGDALVQALEQRAGTRLQQKQRGALADALSNTDLSTSEGQKGFLQTALSSGAPMKDALGILDRAIKQEQVSKQGFQYSGPEELKGLFRRLGIPEDQSENYAELYQNLSQGGKTSFANMFIDRLQRGEINQPLSAGTEVQKQAVGEQPQQAIGQPLQQAVEPQPISPAEEEFVYPSMDAFEGLTPKEKVGRQQLLLKENTPIYKETAKSKRSSDDITRSLEQMKRLNDTGKLPSGIGRLNVKIKEGKLFLPAGANPETQNYVKLVNDFTVKAKDTFGARVTNFELETFMQRLPTLANSEEGRRTIQDQMLIVNSINGLYQKALVDVYDEYGTKNIEPAEAERIAAKKVEGSVGALEQKYAETIQSQEIYDMKQRVNKGNILMEKDGVFKQLPENQQEKAIQKGWRAR